MRKLVPFKLDPIFRATFDPTVPCADCGKKIKFRQAKIMMVDISEKQRGGTSKNISLDELAQNFIRMFLCQECWRRQNPGEPDQEAVH